MREKNTGKKMKCLLIDVMLILIYRRDLHKRLSLLILGLLFLSAVNASYTELSSCGAISSSGSYVLTQNVSSTATCFSISANNVVLDCKGHSITYNTDGISTRMGIDAVSGTNPRTNLTVRNCIIIKPNSLQTSGYGIRLTRYSNSMIVNNTIYTNGTTNNYGIFLTTDSFNNTIENNTVYASGSSTGNVGIYIFSNSGSSIIRRNTIYTSGTTTGYGIWIRTNSHNTRIEDNSIFTDGSAPSSTTSSFGIYLNNIVNGTIIRNNNINTDGRNQNYGIYLLTDVYRTIIQNNSVVTNGTLSANYGIAIAATTTSQASDNEVSNNVISANGLTVTNYGIYIYRNSNRNNISNNIITTSGTTTGHGIYLLGVSGGPTDENIIHSNEIYTSGTASTSNNHGIFLSTNGNSNSISSNVVYVTGSSSYGIHLLGTTLPVDDNIISSNSISTQGTGANNFGIYLFNGANKNIIENNSITTNGTSTNYGIYISGTSVASHNNIVFNNAITASGSLGTNRGIYLYRNVVGTNVTNNRISTSGTSSNDGIYVIGTNTLPVDENIFMHNFVNATGEGGGQFGIYLTTNADENIIMYNDIYTSGTTGNDGIGIVGTTVETSNNNLIAYNNVTIDATTTSNWGIYLATNANNNSIFKNRVMTTGSDTNYGIYISGASFESSNNKIYENEISTNGTGNTNIGIYLYRNTNYNNVTRNNISTYGDESNHGIMVIGTTGLNADYNIIESNNIDTAGFGRRNYGVHLSSNANNNWVKENRIITKGTNQNYGVYLLGTSALSASNNNILSNSIFVSGTTSNFGIYLLTNSNLNNISNNNITSIGESASIGISISGTTSSSSGNTISGNRIEAIGSSSFGIQATINTQENRISENLVYAEGFSDVYGIYLLGSSNNPVQSNQIDSNTIVTNCTSLFSFCHGLYLRNLASHNYVYRNIIKTSGNSNDLGIYLFGTGALVVESNTIEANQIESSSGDAIRVGSLVANTTIINNNLSSASGNYDINILSAAESGTRFIEQHYQSFNFAGIGETIKIVENYGEIEFTQRVTGSGANMADLVVLRQNYAFVNSHAQPGLNRSAIITLNNLSYSHPLVLRDGQPCQSCQIISNSDGKIRFSVPHFSAYSIGDNSMLEIFDDTDYIESNGPVNFYANYTNRTSGEPIIGADCTIAFTDGTYTMSYNSTMGLYTYFRNLGQGMHTYTVSCSALLFSSLNATDYTAIAVFSAPKGANVTILGSERASISVSPDDSNAEAGNVSAVNLFAISISRSWQGFYGNVTGDIILEGASGSNFYNWNIASPQGQVYAARSASIDFDTVACADLPVIEAEEMHIGHSSSASDSVRNTFSKNAHPALFIGNIHIAQNSCSSTNLYVDSAAQEDTFFQVLLRDSASNLIYASVIDAGKIGFDNKTHDFQMIVGENGDDMQVTAYYFFVEIW
jgi:hypothetical protein